jgi:hypothetical protein
MQVRWVIEGNMPGTQDFLRLRVNSAPAGDASVDVPCQLTLTTANKITVEASHPIVVSEARGAVMARAVKPFVALHEVECIFPASVLLGAAEVELYVAVGSAALLQCSLFVLLPILAAYVAEQFSLPYNGGRCPNKLTAIDINNAYLEEIPSLELSRSPRISALYWSTRPQRSHRTFS